MCVFFNSFFSLMECVAFEFSLGVSGLEVLVLQQCFVALLGSHRLKCLPLDLSGLVVQEDADEDDDGAHGAEDRDLVAEHEDAQPDGQGVFNGAGNTGGETGETLILGFSRENKSDSRKTVWNYVSWTVLYFNTLFRVKEVSDIRSSFQ